MAKRKPPFDDRWERTPGNLLVPRRPLPWRFIQKFGTAKCCCEGSGACSCDNCTNNTAPCCWEVSIGGLADDSCASCASRLSQTWLLKQTAGGCSYSCTMPTLCSSCGDVTCSLTVSATTITVTCAGVTWSKATTDCMSAHTLTYQSGGSTCGGASSTCTIAPSSKSSDECACGCNVDCFYCRNVPVSPTVYLPQDMCNWSAGTYALPNWTRSSTTCYGQLGNMKRIQLIFNSFDDSIQVNVDDGTVTPSKSAVYFDSGVLGSPIWECHDIEDEQIPLYSTYACSDAASYVEVTM